MFGDTSIDTYQFQGDEAILAIEKASKYGLNN